MIIPKVENMKSPRTGKPVANQYILIAEGRGALGNFIRQEAFQSYKSIIAVRTIWEDETMIELDKTYWNYSRTTSKYRSMFLNETTKETQTKIDSGEYRLANLN